MTLAELIEDARMNYRKRALFQGVDTPASRAYYRLLTSLDQAVTHGIIDITLYLTQGDFHLLCLGMEIDPDEAIEKQMHLTDDTPILVPNDQPPFSMLVGFSADGRTTPFPVLTDEAFVALLNQPSAPRSLN